MLFPADLGKISWPSGRTKSEAGRAKMPLPTALADDLAFIRGYGRQLLGLDPSKPLPRTALAEQWRDRYRARLSL